MPLVSFAAVREAYFRDAGARYNDIVYWSKPADWRYRVVASNCTVLRAVFFINLVGGPVVVRVPPADDGAVSGALVNSWNVPLAAIGCDGLDQGRGADYTLLPPHHLGGTASELSIGSTTYNVHGSVRVIPKSSAPEDVASSIAYLRSLQVFRASGDRSPARFIDLPGTAFDGMVRFDASFYGLLAQMVLEEPVDGHDLAFMGQIHSVGIGKGVAFSADPPTTRLLDSAMLEVRAYVTRGFQSAGARRWPNRRWRSILDGEVLDTNLSCIREDRILIDERAQLAFATLGLGWDLTRNVHLKTSEDSQGQGLNGTYAYRLRVPSAVATGDYWSVAVYDAESAAFIRKAPVVGVDSFTDRLARNPDGSVDVHLSPLPLPEREENWIATAVNRPFFVVYHNCSSDGDAGERISSCMLEDVERLDSDAFLLRR